MVAPATAWLLAFDLDGTVLGSGEDDLRQALAAARERFILAYVSGRNLACIQGLVDEGRVRKPDFAAGAVGTELGAWGPKAEATLNAWQARVPKAWPAGRPGRHS